MRCFSDTDFLQKVRPMLSAEEEEQLTSVEERVQSFSGVT
jgi:hypothetical protein